MGSKASLWIKNGLRMLGQAFVIIAIILTLDFVLLATVFSGWKRNWADAATAYTQACISTPYHHDLAPNANSTRVWGEHQLFLPDGPLRLQDRRLRTRRSRKKLAGHL